MLKQDYQPTAAIIGAGIAGLSCALKLQAQGFNVEIFEKSRGPSGRMSTRNSPSWSADHGAQYFTARDPLFIQELNLWMKHGVAAVWQPRLHIFENGQWQQSASTENRYVGVPAMNTPGKHLAQQLNAHYSHTIDHISYKHAKWSLNSAEHGKLDGQFDFIVLALPAPQAFNLTNSVDQSLMKENKAEMLGCWTVMASFAEQQNISFDAAFINGEIISWVSKNTSKPGRAGLETWTIHANPQWSQQWIELDSKEVSKRILDCAQGLGLDFQDAELSVHRWRYASGSLSSKPQFCLYKNIQLGLCGDWLHGGRVEGAWLSGHKLANEIITQSVHLIK